jgi:hypothetical protein
LTPRAACAQCATIEVKDKRSRAVVENRREASPSIFEKMRKCGCGAEFFVVRDDEVRRARDIATRLKGLIGTSHTDSESRFWQQKNFLRKMRLRLVAAPRRSTAAPNRRRPIRGDITSDAPSILEHRERWVSRFGPRGRRARHRRDASSGPILTFASLLSGHFCEC